MFDIRTIQEQALYNAVKAISSGETAEAVVHGAEKQSSREDCAAWVKNTMARLESQFDRATVKQIRMHCQCGYGMEEKLALLRELLASSSDMETFAGQDKARAAGLSCTDGTLYLQFPVCPCPMLSKVDRLETDSWCQCTTGYSKVLFEKAFGCTVDVELLKSIKMGDDVCLMKILPRGCVWNESRT